MRDHLVLFVNGVRRRVAGRDAFLSLSDYLRRRLGLVGTKIVCSEGDCGACTTLVGRPNAAGDDFDYRPVDSCIQFLFQLDGAHVVTVDGLARSGALTPVQQALVDGHGSQCGFCTPGFVMAMTGLLQRQPPADPAAWRRGLTGNLCRCTGYAPIVEAAIQCDAAEAANVSALYPPQPMLAELTPLAADAIELSSPANAIGGPPLAAFCPTTLADALAILAAHPEARLVAGATDVGVRANKTGALPATILDLGRVAELDYVQLADGELRCGARATWSALLDAVAGERAPALQELAHVLSVFGAPQIRHVGTIGGNIANASPIADSLPFLFVTDATLVVASAAGRREAPINGFFRGYKQLDLRPGELIAEVRAALPRDDELFRLYKTSRRRDLDISTFTAAIRMRLDGPSIAEARIALGGVGPVVLRAPRTEEFLVGREFSAAVMRQAGDVVVQEIAPITDVRGSADYRRSLARNVLVKFYHQSAGVLAAA